MQTISQLALNLPVRHALGRADFCVSACNAEAAHWIDRWPDWPFHCLLLYGDSGCGKTHLGRIFSDFQIEAAALPEADFETFPQKIVVENVSANTNETALFHLYNFALESGRSVILTARSVPDFQLPDLQSRMQAMLKVQIKAPDDELLFALLMKGFSERQILVPADVLEYIVKNTERSFAAIQTFLKAADQLSLEQKRKITIPVAKQILSVSGGHEKA